MSTELEVVSKAIANITAVSEGLKDLSKQYEGVVFPVATPKGMDEAKAARAAIREPRYSVEKIRKDAKAPILALGKKLDAEAARITGELLKIEDPIDAQIKNEEQRKERERQEKIEAEQKRVADLQERVTELRGNQLLSAMDGSQLIAEHLADLERIAVDDSFQEFRQQAEDAKAVGVARIRQLHVASIAHEAEQARILKERAELAALRVAEERRQTEERARLIEEERQAKAARDAETAKQAEALRLEREALDAERAKQAEQERAAKALRDAEEARIAAERAKLEREQAEAKRIADEAERAKLAAAEADRKRKDEAALASKKAKYPGERAILEALGKHFGVTETVVRAWLIELRKAA